MSDSKYRVYKIVGVLLVALMALLQVAYAVYAFYDPAAFSQLRGTELISAGDSDWVRIYASRTLFVAFVIGYLLYLKNYQILKWVAIIGIVMPVTDAVLAYQAQATIQIVLKHAVTAMYLLATFYVLQSLTRRSSAFRPAASTGRSSAAPLN